MLHRALVDPSNALGQLSKVISLDTLCPNDLFFTLYHPNQFLLALKVDRTFLEFLEY